MSSRIIIFLKGVVLPLSIAILTAILSKPVYITESGINYFLMWLCVGLPFGFRQVMIWLAPRNVSISHMAGILGIAFIMGGFLGCVTLFRLILHGIITTVSGEMNQ